MRIPDNHPLRIRHSVPSSEREESPDSMNMWGGDVSRLVVRQGVPLRKLSGDRYWINRIWEP